jgi:hypothetical protein
MRPMGLPRDVAWPTRGDRSDVTTRITDCAHIECTRSAASAVSAKRRRNGVTRGRVSANQPHDGPCVSANSRPSWAIPRQSSQVRAAMNLELAAAVLALTSRLTHPVLALTADELGHPRASRRTGPRRNES